MSLDDAVANALPNSTFSATEDEIAKVQGQVEELKQLLAGNTVPAILVDPSKAELKRLGEKPPSSLSTSSN